MRRRKGLGKTARQSQALMRVLIKAQTGICTGCGKPLPDDMAQRGVKRDDRLSVDHTVPRAKGGRNGLGNLTIMHMLCNEMKGDDTPTGCELIWLLAVNCRIGVEPMRW